MTNVLDCKHPHVESAVHRVGLNHWIYRTCPDCGHEWTETETVADIQDAVTADEIIEVHELFKADKTLGELIPKEKQT